MTLSTTLSNNTSHHSSSLKKEEPLRIYLLRQRTAPKWWDVETPDEVIVGYTLCFETAETWARSSSRGCDRKYTGIFPIDPMNHLIVTSTTHET
jgi:hypothetical protein